VHRLHPNRCFSPHFNTTIFGSFTYPQVYGKVEKTKAFYAKRKMPIWMQMMHQLAYFWLAGTMRYQLMNEG
jgi:hypothetical protein